MDAGRSTPVNTVAATAVAGSLASLPPQRDPPDLVDVERSVRSVRSVPALARREEGRSRIRRRFLPHAADPAQLANDSVANSIHDVVRRGDVFSLARDNLQLPRDVPVLSVHLLQVPPVVVEAVDSVASAAGAENGGVEERPGLDSAAHDPLAADDVSGARGLAEERGVRLLEAPADALAASGEGGERRRGEDEGRGVDLVEGRGEREKERERERSLRNGERERERKGESEKGKGKGERKGERERDKRTSRR